MTMFVVKQITHLFSGRWKVFKFPWISRCKLMWNVHLQFWWSKMPRTFIAYYTTNEPWTTDNWNGILVICEMFIVPTWRAIRTESQFPRPDTLPHIFFLLLFKEKSKNPHYLSISLFSFLFPSGIHLRKTSPDVFDLISFYFFVSRHVTSKSSPISDLFNYLRLCWTSYLSEAAREGRARLHPN